MHGLVLFSLKAINSLARLLSIEPPFSALVADMTTTAQLFFDHDRGLFVSEPTRQVSWVSQAWMALGEALPPSTCKSALLVTMRDPSAIKPLTPYLYHYAMQVKRFVARHDQDSRLDTSQPRISIHYRPIITVNLIWPAFILTAIAESMRKNANSTLVRIWIFFIAKGFELLIRFIEFNARGMGAPNPPSPIAAVDKTWLYWL
jgi:hypothetical protein